jgi:hypothetical protein
MKSGRDIVSHLENIILRVRDLKIIDPLQLALQCRSIVYSWISIFINAWIGDVAIHVSNVCWCDGGARVNAQSWFGITPAISDAEYREKNPGEKSPKKAWKKNVVR